ncbi:Similarity [Alloactinosynnema sp. L-07]|uniref:hypothetical protein n=1 Tax=Alloactinosynnema sp. L-07 TaxID=1653480 RepID=UPI00065F07F4|nr:hypothetical protein [Alloactinosynnema sp. L-07]CRK60539.1 Similarity [Alloactinosynnema sp. L-07]
MKIGSKARLVAMSFALSGALLIGGTTGVANAYMEGDNGSPADTSAPADSGPAPDHDPRGEAESPGAGRGSGSEGNKSGGGPEKSADEQDHDPRGEAESPGAGRGSGSEGNKSGGGPEKSADEQDHDPRGEAESPGAGRGSGSEGNKSGGGPEKSADEQDHDPVGEAASPGAGRSSGSEPSGLVDMGASAVNATGYAGLDLSNPEVANLGQTVEKSSLVDFGDVNNLVGPSPGLNVNSSLNSGMVSFGAAPAQVEDVVDYTATFSPELAYSPHRG